MTPWQQSFENHKFIAKLDEILSGLDGTSVEGWEGPNLEQYARLVKALKFIRARLKSIDPELVSQTSLQNLGSWITNIADQVQSFSATKNFGNIQNANTSADSMLDVVRTFRTTSKEHEQVVASAASAFRDRAIEEIERVRKHSEESHTELSALQKEIKRTQSTLEENNRTIEQQKGRLDQSIAEFQKQFSQSEADRSKEFTAAATKLSEQVTTQT